MILNVKSFLKSAVADYFSKDTKLNVAFASTARRVGPQRVIFTARQSDGNSEYELGKILLQTPICSYGKTKPNEEPVVVRLDARNKQALPLSPAILEKRTTLKVKPDTKWLSVIYIDGTDQMITAEQIKIE